MNKLIISILPAVILPMLVAPAFASVESQQKPAAERLGSQTRPFQRPTPDQIFDRMDTNKDGMISRAEFKAASHRFQDRREQFRQRRIEEMKKN